MGGRQSGLGWSGMWNRREDCSSGSSCSKQLVKSFGEPRGWGSAEGVVGDESTS